MNRKIGIPQSLTPYPAMSFRRPPTIALPDTARLRVGSLTGAYVRAYATTTSCFAGESITICLASSTTALGAYTLRLVRAHDQQVMPPYDAAPVPISVPVIPEKSESSHANEYGYNWPSSDSTTLETYDDWESGLYFAEVLENGLPLTSSRAFFVVRSSKLRGENSIILHWPFANVHAYSGVPWGHRTCLYDSDEQLRARRVTTQKPVMDSGLTQTELEVTDGCGCGMCFTCPAMTLFRWLRNNGYGVDVCSSFDLHNDPGVLDGYKLLILSGHDEYWSCEMRDRVENFIASGGNMAVFAGNVAWWQIRYEPDSTRIVCYKNAFEDPLLGLQDWRVTANWASAPASRPENGLTGLGTRYGFCGTNGWPPLKIVAPDHPAFEGLVGDGDPPLTEFGAGLAALGGPFPEADGIELDLSDLNNPKPTLRDGAPDTFVVLAYNEDLCGTGPMGRGVMGYYTNVGTVLACPFTNWVGQIATDSVIAQITRNVINWLNVDRSGPVMGPSQEVLPPDSWTLVETGPCTAMTALFQGRVVGAVGRRLFSRHPDMADGWVEVSQAAPPDSDFGAIGTNLYGTTLFAAMGNQLFCAGVYCDAKSGVSVDGWSSLLPTVGDSETIKSVVSPNHGNTLFILVATDDFHAELRTMLNNNCWYRVGDATGIVALTVCDGYLVGATNDGRLVTRLGGPLRADYLLLADETWIDIGEVPADTFALGQYFGRLYALIGSPLEAQLQWRSLRPDQNRLPVEHGRLLFYNKDSGGCAVGRFLGNGDYENIINFDVGAGWTHVTRVNDGMVLFYSSSNGQAILGRILDDGTWEPVGDLQSGFSPWSIVVSDGEHVLFYQQDPSVFGLASSSRGDVGFFDPTSGHYTSTLSSDQFSSGWLCAAATWGLAAAQPDGRGKYIVFYAPDGRVAIGVIDSAGQFSTVGYASVLSGADRVVAAGQLGVFFYDSATGGGEFGEFSFGLTPQYTYRNRWSDFDPGWTLGAGRNGLVVFYKTVDNAGYGKAGGFSRDGIFEELNVWGTDAGLSPGWSHIIAV